MMPTPSPIATKSGRNGCGLKKKNIAKGVTGNTILLILQVIKQNVCNQTQDILLVRYQGFKCLDCKIRPCLSQGWVKKIGGELVQD